MNEHDTGQEPPGRQPDRWIAPGAGDPAERATWQQPPRPGRGGRSDPAPSRSPYAWRVQPFAPPSPGRPLAPFSRTRLALLVIALSVAALTVLLVATLLVGVAVVGRSGSPGTRPTSRSTPAPPPGTVGTIWTRDPASLRPGLAGAEFLGSLDGSFEQSYVAEMAGRWLTVTGSATASDTALHAFDPATGEVRWQRELDGVLCATDAGTLGKGGARRTAVYCASVLDRDRATSLGTRWRLHALDPATGEDLATADVDAWATAVHWTGSTFVVLEQRQPAPHAVVRGFSADLRERWAVDLVDRPGQAEMFTENRVILRPEPERPGLALDRPRLRDVGDGLLAVWAGQRTAFVDPADGRVVMMPHCSRLVDDGERLWCNEVDGATAYSYAGRELVRVRGPRLAFPDDDGVGEDRNRPVFLDEDGAGVGVDVRTGAVGKAWTPPGRSSAFGQATMPSTEAAGGRTFLVGRAGAMLLDARKDRVVWRNPEITLSDVPILVGDDKVLLGSGRIYLVDLASGRIESELRFQGLYVVGVGTRVAGVGSELLSLARV